MMLHFGRNLAYLRKLNRLEQKDIAKLVNKSLATVSMWETGKREPTVEVLYLPVLSCFLVLKVAFSGHF